jgi:hypothetical protein
MAEGESMAKPDGVLDDFRWEAVALIHHCGRFHTRILTDWELICQYPILLCHGRPDTFRDLLWVMGKGSGYIERRNPIFLDLGS